MNKIQPQIELFPSFIGNLPTKPYCTDDLSTGLKIRPRDTALAFKYIQPNSPFYQHYFVLDLDYESAMSEILYSLDVYQCRILLLKILRMEDYTHFSS